MVSLLINVVYSKHIVCFKITSNEVLLSNICLSKMKGKRKNYLQKNE